MLIVCEASLVAAAGASFIAVVGFKIGLVIVLLLVGGAYSLPVLCQLPPLPNFIGTAVFVVA